MLPSQTARTRRKKSATQILPALVASQARLTHRNAHTFQQTGFQVQSKLRMPPAHLRHGRAGQQFSMIKAALTLLNWVQGHRNNQHLPGRVCGRDNGFEAIRQQPTQPPGDRLHTLVLEQMHQ